jgi:hypothetical protein
MSGGRGSMDIARFSRLAKRPGVDPRMWLAVATVTEVAVDPEVGAYAEVELAMAGGDQETARISSGLAGAGYGLWMPLFVGDLVVIGYPGGEADYGPVLIGRLWGGQLPPPPETVAATQGARSVETGRDPTDDVVLRAKDGTSVRAYASGTGGMTLKVEGSGNVTIEQAGTGNITLKVASGQFCYVGGEAGAQPIPLGNTLQTFLESIQLAFDGHVHPIPSPAPPAPWVTSPPVPLIGAVPNTRATKGKVV